MERLSNQVTPPHPEVMKVSPSNRGVALVIVLGFLVLLSGLAIAFFSSVTTELTASRTYASNVSTRQLADTAVSMVMGQIREATGRKGAAWGSQPGMIRVYRDGSTPPANHSPNADGFFKLYSARNMVLTASDIKDFDPGADPAPYASDRDGKKGDAVSDWNKYPALFADLNHPILVSDPANPKDDPQPVFPILDPRAKDLVNGRPLVEGFDFSADVNLAVDSGNPDKWRIPMPARWIYVLQDGTLTTPKQDYTPAGGGTGAEFTAGDYRTPTKDNPIVGRISFWADDDTSKININTAGGHGKKADNGTGYDDGYDGNSYSGSFWDTPRVYTNFDIGQTDPNTGELLLGVGAGGLASTQPYQREYQRYPGHPATTSLGAVFSALLTSEQIYKLTPRLNEGGSKGGTIRTQVATAVEMQLKPERLYASLDELLYSEAPVNGGQRKTNDSHIGASGAVTPDKLEKMKFFLTPHSRAPDLNLFGRPRVAIWPVHATTDESSGRNAFDRAIAYCSTIGGKKFIFTRTANVASTGALSSTMDITASTNSQNSWLLKDYLGKLTETAIPGFGGNFKTKYGVDNRNMILGQIFDYIRIANLRDTTLGMTNNQYAKKGVVAPSRADVFGSGKKVGGFGRAATISEASLVFYCSGVEAAGARKKSDSTIIAPGVYQGEVLEDDRDKITHNYMRAFVIFQTFHPMQGYAPIVSPADDKEKQHFEVQGLSGLKANGSDLFPGGTLTNKSNWVSGSTWAGRNFGGYEGFMHTLASHHDPNAADGYQFSSEKASATLAAVKLDANVPTFNFSGGTVDLTVKFGPTQVLQTIKLVFPSATWPIPRRWYRLNQGGFLVGDQTATFNNRAKIESAQNLLDLPSVRDPYDPNRSLPGRITWTLKDANNPNTDPNNKEFNGIYGSGRWLQIVQPGDVIRSLVYGTATTGTTKTGDLRLLALSDPDVKNTDFKPHADYGSQTLRMAQGLRAADGNIYFSKTAYWDIDQKKGLSQKGALLDETLFGNHVVASSKVPASKAIQLPYSVANNNGVTGVVRSDNRAGDFDTGLGVFADGPFGGKQDEGNVIFKYFHEPTQKWIYPIPYAGNQAYEAPGDIFFSPNRQMPSPVLFGSLLSRPAEGRGWETLAFCPNTVGERHPGNVISPKDHLLLDLFTMPFVEPYLISEPLSTAGRVNLNYQIAPFGYIKRSTALRAALASLRVSAIKTSLITSYKSGKSIGGVTKPLPDQADNIRFEINADETIKAIDGFFGRFKTGPAATRINTGFFKSASEICERFLYPMGPGGVKPVYQATAGPYSPVNDASGTTAGEADMLNFWRSGRGLTGDNLREKPYADLYPRVTTKSNTYTVHMRVQTLRQMGVDSSSGGKDFSKWREGKDVIIGEYRGATTIERYIDPSDPRLVTKVNETDPTKQSLEDIYRFRVVGTKRFAP